MPGDRVRRIIQTCDASPGSRYGEMMDISGAVNRAYCAAHGYEYLEFRGIKFGVHAWHACMNRMSLLREEVARPAAERGWVAYMDADAMVVLPGERLESVTSEPESRGKLLLICRGCNDNPVHLEDINTGVLFFDTAHPDAERFLAAWSGIMEMTATPDMLRASSSPFSMVAGNLLIDDQSSLSMLISVLRVMGAAPRLVRRFCGEHAQRFNYNGGIIAQQIRPADRQLNMDERIAGLRQRAAAVAQAAVAPAQEPRRRGRGAAIM